MAIKSIQAKSAGTRGSTVSFREASPDSGRSPAAMLDEIRRLLRDGQVHDARRLAAEAVKAHPDYRGLRQTHEVLNVGRSRRSPATGRSTREALEPLRDPPEEYRGKWVAVVGREIVGVADSLKELVARLPSDLGQTPLAVQIAS